MQDDGDPDNGTISQSVAMAIAGSPLPHAKAPNFTMPTVVSNETPSAPLCCVELTASGFHISGIFSNSSNPGND